MNIRLGIAASGALVISGLLIGSAFSGSGRAAGQIDPTAQQQTIDALVADRFTQTAAVQQQSAAQTAAFNATVDAAFAQALTATAAAPPAAPPLLPPGLRNRLRALFEWGDTRVVQKVLTPTPLVITTTAAPTFTPLPAAPTLRPELFPTNTVAQVQIAEQVFEHGRMFWIRHTRQIWVMVNVPSDNPGGDWFCYNDTFVEGEAEVDPALVSPEGMYQPRRGFGKLWRSHPELQAGMGWAVTPEFELTSAYTYLPGGYVENTTYFPGPGEHRLTTLYGESISFFESDLRGDCLGGSWRMTP
jgi:hypothetical protein